MRTDSNTSSGGGAVAAAAAIQQYPHLSRCSVASSDDSWRTEMTCAFPGPTVTRCCPYYFKFLQFYYVRFSKTYNVVLSVNVLLN